MPDASRTPKIEKTCPLPSAHTRLRQAHELWHRTANAYPDPDEFVLNLNQFLVTLRQVTFMLQKQKARIPDFDAWYEDWRERMREDQLMGWLRDARTIVEKTGDLELASTARVAIVASWLDGPYRELEVSPLLGPQDMAGAFPFEELPDEIRKEGLLQVERRWVSRDLPDHELTDVCAHGYGVMATLLSEAHNRLGFRMQTFGGESHEGRHHRTDHLGGRLPCMTMTAAGRTAHLHLGSGDLISDGEAKVSFNPARDAELFEERAQEMTIGPGALTPNPDEDPLDWGARWMSVARRTLSHDGYHLPHAFLFNRNYEPLNMIALRFEDQAEKYLAFRRVAHEVDRLGADIVIIINETWEAYVPISQVRPGMPRPTERADRKEALLTIVATSDGKHRSYHAPFTRDTNGHPVLGQTKTVDDTSQLAPSLEPIRQVWARWPRRAPGPG